MRSDVDFTDLHVHSSYSLLDGAANPAAIVDATKKLGRKCLSLTDHGNVDGLLVFQKACQKSGIKPIFGQEIYVTENFGGRNEEKIENLHLTALAKTREGLSKLIQATGFAHNEGWSKTKRRPFLPMDYPLRNNWAGDLIILTGCASSPFWNAKDGAALLKSYKDTFGADLYAEVMPNCDWAQQRVINAAALNASMDLGLKVVTTTDVHYVSKEDSEFHEVIIGLAQTNRGITWNNPKRWKFDSHCSYVHTTQDIHEAYNQLGTPSELTDEWIINTQEVAEKCFHEIPKVKIQLPRVLDCPDEEEFGQFVEIVAQGFKRRGLPENDEYLNRLRYEMKILQEKDFVRYILMVWDLVRWAKANGVFVGVGRGSAGGSLIVYCMGITEVDPVRFRLFFERFIDPKRVDYPDIDVDFEDRNRHLIEEYLKSKYGTYNVAHITTFGAMLGRGAIRDVSRLFEVEQIEADRCAKGVIHRNENEERSLNTIEDSIEENPDVKAFAQKYPHVVKHAIKLEGQIRGCGVHASGILVSPEDLRTSGNCYLVKRNDKEADERKIAVNWDMKDVEHMGMIKLDVLGLATLSVVAEALKLIERRHGVKIDMGTLPLDDKKTFEMVGRGETATCFQIGTPGPMKFCRDMKPDHFEHLAAVTALWRPGPLTSGGTEMYKRCKLGLEKPVYYNDAYREVTEISYGQLIYQEQIAGLLMKLAGYSYEAADGVRKIVSKKLGPEEWAKHTDRFIEGCKKMGSLDEATAKKLWESLSIFALYAFNRSHSVAYGMMAYQTAYLKANYPAEWLCAYLNYGSSEKEDPKTGEISRDVAIREACRIGLPILPPDLNKSGVMWTVEDREGKPSLRVGLKDVHHVGPTAIEAIEKLKIGIGQVKSLDQLFQSVDRQVVNKSVIRGLLFSGALDEIMTSEERRLWINLFDEVYESLGKPKKWASIGDISYVALSAAVLARLRSENLRFDPWALTGKSMTEDLVDVLGDSFLLEQSEDGEVIVRGNQRWAAYEAMAGVMPGANGVLKLASTSGIRALRSETKTCQQCSLHETCKGPVPLDPGAINVMVVGEAPGKDEDREGKPFVGDAGSVLWRALAERGITREYVHVSNAVKCRPPKRAGSYKPTPEEISGCPWLARELAHLRPKVVLSLGNSPLYFFGGRKSGIMSMNGKTEWNHKHKCWITYALHPASTLYRPEDLQPFKTAIAEFARVVAQFA